MRVEWLIACALLGACDVVWSVDRVHGDDDAVAGDAANTVSCEQDKHDEDGDMFPDACDRCPGVADDQADDDNDGVGNACDPSGSEQNELALFVSFAEKTPTWNVVNGSWPLDGENLVYDSVSLASNAYVLYSGVMPEPPYVVDYTYTLDGIDNIGSLFMLLLDANASGTGLNCGHYRQTSPSLHDVVRASYPPASNAAETDIMTVTPGTYRVKASYDRNGDLRCSLAGPSTGGATSIHLGTPPAAGTLGFRSLQIGVHVRSIAIYKAR